MKKFITAALSLMLIMGLAGCSSSKKELVFADPSWDSGKFHNSVAGYIAQTAYDYPEYKEITGSSTVLMEGIKKNEFDVHMEMWTDNLPTYYKDLEAGAFKELGINFDDNMQGFYVPRYVIEGDPARGIEPMAPDLKTVQDLKKYSHIFVDDEQKDKGRIYGAIPGWEIDEVMHNKYLYYGLDENYIYFRPGSDAALSAALSNAYEKGQPVVGYYWEPTWMLGKYDFVLLEDAPYIDVENFKAGKTACPAVKVTVATSNNFYDRDPEYCDFLLKYETSSKLTSEALAYMQDTGADHGEAAIWFLKNNDALLEEWMPKDKADMVRASLSDTTKSINKSKFPVVIPMNLTAVDNAVRSFSNQFSGFFDAIKNGLNASITGIYNVLNFIPWFVLVGLMFIAGWKLSGRWLTGVIYAAMLFMIGTFGLWELMNETLSIVLASVIISLIIGLPIGVFISESERADKIIRPILDTMQTMPVFVYLIPAIIFFGLGKAPAVIATTIYAVVPVIRMTSHGIRQVDVEVIEAAKSYGSTRPQALIKVLIPQALPTIMAGVNQTIMMAMAMVVTCSMIGASGLGMEVLIGVNRMEIGRGLVSGTAVVILAVLLDRITQGLTKKSEVNTDGK